MATNARRPAVRFTLGAMQKTSDYQSIKNGILKEHHDPGRDSGAPSPDYSLILQPASIRLVHNQQRIKFLNAINDILQERVEYESSRTTLVNLHDDLKKKLRKKTEECIAAKKMHLIDAKANTKYLEKEREQLVSQIERLNAHLKQHAEEHEQHARSDGEEDTSLKSLAFKNITKIFDKKPSRKADQKLAAARLLREVQQLRSRLAALERRLEAETRRKKQAEEELSILKAALSRQRGKRVERYPLKQVKVN